MMTSLPSRESTRLPERVFTEDKVFFVITLGFLTSLFILPLSGGLICLMAVIGKYLDIKHVEGGDNTVLIKILIIVSPVALALSYILDILAVPFLL